MLPVTLLFNIWILHKLGYPAAVTDDAAVGYLHKP